METKECKKCKVTLELSEFYKSRDGRSYGSCKKCDNQANKEYRENNRERIAEKKVIYCIKNKAKLNERSRLWDLKNRDRRLENMAKWAKSCPDKRASYKAVRRARKKSAIPNWLTQEDLNTIKCLYTKAKELGAETGDRYEIDHIIPLVHPLVCGLHIPRNLQVISAKENRVKGNKFTPYIESEVNLNDYV